MHDSEKAWSLASLRTTTPHPSASLTMRYARRSNLPPANTVGTLRRATEDDGALVAEYNFTLGVMWLSMNISLCWTEMAAYLLAFGGSSQTSLLISYLQYIPTSYLSSTTTLARLWCPDFWLLPLPNACGKLAVRLPCWHKCACEVNTRVSNSPHDVVRSSKLGR